MTIINHNYSPFFQKFNTETDQLISIYVWPTLYLLKSVNWLKTIPGVLCFDSCGSRDKCLFSVIRDHLNNVLIKQNSCFNNKTFITHFCFKIKQIKM